MTLLLGKRAATYDSRDLRYADVRAGVSLPPAPPPGGGYGMDFGAAGWLMLGNGPDATVFGGFNGCGDCAWAGPAHEVMESCKNAGRPVPAFSGKTVVDQYSAYSGYDPQTGANDNGSNVRDVLNWRQTKGLLDDAGTAHKIGAYVALEPGNLDQFWEALWLFDAVGIGIKFPNSAMDQTNAGQMWSVVPGAQIDGGHYIPLVGHPTAGVWTCVTWGQRQTMTTQFLSTYCDEAWAWIDPERYSQATGETPQGFRDADLEKYLTAVAQQKAP
jgi:hypothetical protein